MLAPGGLLAFTAETHEGRGVVLTEGLRYAHAADYLRDQLRRAGLAVALAASSALGAARKRRAAARAWCVVAIKA